MTVRLSELTISLPVADRRRALEFYRAALDLEPVGEPAEDGIPEPLQLRLDERTLLALIPAGGLGWVLGERPLAPSGTSEVLLGVTVATVTEVDDLLDRAGAAGGSTLSPATHRDWGYTGICADPDGHAWEITAVVER